jgi:hypothetical protein
MDLMKTHLWSTMGRLGATVAGTDPCSTGGHPKLSTKKGDSIMNKFRFTIKILAIATFMFAFASLTQAQATRTWVSGVGDDANPCSRTAPCKTFAGAISKTAAGGIIDALDPGGFGAVTITKSITLDSCCIAGVLASGSNAININGAGAVVNLRHLDIEGVGLGVNGVSITNAASVVIEDCVIFGFTTRGISDTRTVSGSLSMRNTIIKQNGQSGAVVFPGGGATVNASFDNCSFVGNGSAGVAIEPNVNLTVFRSVSTGNVGAGFLAEGNATANVNLESSIASHNGQGITANTNAIVRVSDSQITNNGTGLNPTAGGQISSYGNNNVTANGAGNGPFNGPPITQQ